jgi:hypothetical protein
MPTRLRIPAARICPGDASFLSLDETEGAGNAGRRCTRASRVPCSKKTHTSSHRYNRTSRHSPRDVGRLIPCSPRRTGRSSHRRPRKLASLTPASGCRDHTASSDASRASSVRTDASIASPPHVSRRLAVTSLVSRRDGPNMGVIWVFRQYRNCATKWHDGQFAHGCDASAVP